VLRASSGFNGMTATMRVELINRNGNREDAGVRFASLFKIRGMYAEI